MLHGRTEYILNVKQGVVTSKLYLPIPTMFRNVAYIVAAATIGYVYAQVSSSCLSETNIIRSDDLIGDFTVGCSEDGYYCFDIYISTDDDPEIEAYTDRCYELDGQVFLYNYEQNCISDFTGLDNMKEWENQPACLGKSCTLDDFRDLREEIWIPNFIEENLPDVCYVTYIDVLSIPLSGTCAAGTIANFDALSGTWPDWSVPDTSGSTFDYRDSTNEYRAACLNSGGVLYAVEEVAVACYVLVNGAPSPYTSTLLNDVYCFGTSCSLSEVQEYINTYYDRITESEV